MYNFQYHLKWKVNSKGYIFKQGDRFSSLKNFRKYKKTFYLKANSFFGGKMNNTIKGHLENINKIALKFGFSMHQIDHIAGEYIAIFTCRDGWDGSDQPANENIHNGIELALNLLKIYPKYEINLDTINEWVNVNIIMIAENNYQ
jgi:hypothetical protein